jgi:diguanylate cyclase (GGDEF)-like protein/PAS domain S-box-containing protein
MKNPLAKKEGTPFGIILFWCVFFGTLIYESYSVVMSYLERGSLKAVIVPHIDALVLVILMSMVLWELRMRHRHLDRSMHTLQAMIDNIPYVVWMKDREGRFISVNDGFIRTVGCDSATCALGKSDYDFWPEEIAQNYLYDDEEVMRTLQKKELEEQIVIDGKRLWMHTFKTAVLDSRGEVIGTVGFARDITEKKEEQYKLQQFIDLQKDIVILTDGEILDFANRALLDFFGYDSLDAFKKDYECVCERFVEHENFFHLGKVIPEDTNWIDALQRMKPESRIVSMINCENEPHAFTVSINSFDDTGLYVVSFADISGTVIETMALKSRVLRDKMTGAFNREYFEHYQKIKIEQFASQGRQSALIFFDIDHFKEVNDTYGHNVGDTVLCELVDTVRKFSREDDVIVRWGGEEFLLLIPVNTIEDAQAVAEHIRFQVAQHDFPTVKRVTCSFGVTLYRNGEALIQTVERADQALYDAKGMGRNRVVAI